MNAKRLAQIITRGATIAPNRAERNEMIDDVARMLQHAIDADVSLGALHLTSDEKAFIRETLSEIEN